MKYFVFFVLIILSVISCSEENTENKDLCKGINCGNAYECNKDTGECEKIDNYCLNDSMCKENQVCDKVANRCKDKEIKKDCSSHEDCRIWEICDFESKKCKARQGMCDKDDDCTVAPFLKCNTNVHKCMNPKSCLYSFCNEWEACLEDEKCHLRPGYCNEDNDCKDRFPYDKCDKRTHKCIRPITVCSSYTQCDINYQYCDLEENLCKAETGKCRSNLDCRENPQNGSRTVCDRATYNCKVPENQSCTVMGCEYWQICNEEIGICELESGRCNDNGDCRGEREICNEAHYCEKDDCTTHGCDWWKYCIKESGECKLYDGMCDTSNDCSGYEPYNHCSLLHTCSKSNIP